MEDIKGLSADGILKFQAKRGITNTFKEALTILEDLEREHKAALKRLEEQLPEEQRALVRVADYWHPEKREALRRRILSVGNNHWRVFEEQIANMEVKFR